MGGALTFPLGNLRAGPPAGVILSSPTHPQAGERPKAEIRSSREKARNKRYEVIKNENQ